MFPNFSKITKFYTTEVVLIVIFILYLIFDVKTPHFVADTAVSPFTGFFYVAVTALLFLYANPVVAILYIVVVYEFVRRSYISINEKANLKSVPNVIKQKYQNSNAKEVRSKVLNNAPLPIMPVKEESSFTNQDALLETEVINKLAPVGRGEIKTDYISSTFNPVYENIGSASAF